jgi:hypothetical protein
MKRRRGGGSRVLVGLQPGRHLDRTKKLDALDCARFPDARRTRFNFLFFLLIVSLLCAVLFCSLASLLGAAIFYFLLAPL